MSDAWIIRAALEADAQALLEIYGPLVEGTAISFETAVPTLAEFEARIATALRGWQWLVAVEGDRCIGYAYASSHRERTAYRWSVEVSAYVHPHHQRRGVAAALYKQLLQDLTRKGFCNAYAGVTLPNDASVALHQSVGFHPIGVFPAVGRKFGKWHDVAWFHLAMSPSPLQE